MKLSRLMLSALAIGICVCAPSATAQCPQREYGWARTGGSPGFDQARGVTVDRDGNIYAVGSFTGKVDFDPSKRKDKLKSKGEDDIYISSYSREGVYRWTRRIGGSSFDFAFATGMTPVGDVVITGFFYKKVDFDPTEGKDIHKATTNNHADIYVTLLHPDGSYGWTKTFGGNSTDIAWGIDVDREGDLLITGSFNETADFNPGRGVDNHTSNGWQDVFVTKLSRNGAYRWTRTWGSGGSNSDIGWRVATDAQNNVFVTGEFRDKVDFDPGKGEDIHVSQGEQDAFITKLGPDGSYQWTHTFGASDLDTARALVTDDTANVYVTGAFRDSVDFDRRGDGDVHKAVGALDAFITKRGPDGSYHWTRTMGGNDVVAGFAIDVNDSGTLVVGGNFGGTADFDFTEGVDEHTSKGGRDAFLLRMTTDGEYRFTDTFGGTERSDALRDLNIDTDGNVVACGVIESLNIDFDPTTGVDLRSTNGHIDFFITKHYCGQCEFVERHTVLGKKGKIISTVRALAPGGKVTVKCQGPKDPIRKTANINNKNTATLKFKKLKKGTYHCLITNVKDRAGQTLCDEETSRRRVNVK